MTRSGISDALKGIGVEHETRTVNEQEMATMAPNFERGYVYPVIDKKTTLPRRDGRPVKLFHLSPFFEIARLLVRFDHVARFIVNANHGAICLIIASISARSQTSANLPSSRR